MKMILCQNLGIYAPSAVLKFSEDVSTQEEFVPGGVQQTQKLEPFWSTDQRLQKEWSGLSPTRNPIHLRLWGLSYPSVKRLVEPLFLFLF